MGGNFTQLGPNPESFHSGGGSFFGVFFEDKPTRTIFFETPGIGVGVPLSHFEDVTLLTNGTVTLNSDMFAHGDFNTSSLWSPTFVGNGNKVAVGGGDVDGMVLDHVLLELNGTPTFPTNGTFTRFDNVTFQNYAATEVQLDIIHPGTALPFIFNNITFTNPPTQGVGAYVRTTDSDGEIPNELHVELTGTSPGTCSGADFIAVQSDIIASCSMQFDEITAGRAHTCGITVTGVAYCWGNNAFGQLGDGGVVTESSVPVLVSDGRTFREISAGNDHTCAITTTSDVYCWGADASGQLGDGGPNTDQSAPTLVLGTAGLFNFVSAGSEHTCAVTLAGAGYCWGKNTEGQLGDSTTLMRTTPAPVSGLVVFKSISAGTGLLGSAHTCGFNTSNVAYCWGDTKSGQLGDGTNTQRLAPTAVSGGTSIAYLASGDQYTCAVTLAGAGKCWGVNADGQLGDGSTTPSNAPVAVAGSLTLDGISTGSRFSCATSLGSVYCWGDNSWGQLGDGSTTNSPMPVMVTGGWILPDLGTAVSEHMCAVTGSGALFCWGEGFNGRLGNGSTADSSVPVLVSGT